MDSEISHHAFSTMVKWVESRGIGVMLEGDPRVRPIYSLVNGTNQNLFSILGPLTTPEALRLGCVGALHKNSNLGECRASSTVPRAKRGGGTVDITPKF